MLRRTSGISILEGSDSPVDGTNGARGRANSAAELLATSLPVLVDGTSRPDMSSQDSVKDVHHIEEGSDSDSIGSASKYKQPNQQGRRFRGRGFKRWWTQSTSSNGSANGAAVFAPPVVSKPRRTFKQWLAWQKQEHRDCVKQTWTEFWTKFRALDKKRTAKQVFARRWWGWWALLITIVACSVTLSRFHDKIIEAIHPVAVTIFRLPWTWTIPVILLIVVSIPPLIGHEIIILIVGVIWGVWWGFLIAIAGTFLGEILCYYLMKHGLRKHAAKFEQKSRLYAGLANIMRRDGLWMIILVRFSAIPGHITTAIQSTIGISVWIFGIAAAVSLPKQLALVYLGVVFGERTVPDTGLDPNFKAHIEMLQRKNKIITWTLFVFTTLLTFVAAYVIWFRMWQVWKEKDAAEAAQTKAEADEAERLARLDDKSGMLGIETQDTIESTYAYTLPAFPGLESEYSRSPPGYTSNMPSNGSIRSGKGSIITNGGGRPGIGPRTRSGTLVGLAFSNNSLPYLPYTPMLDLPNRLPPSAREHMPSAVPSAVVTDPDEDRNSIHEERPYTPPSQSPVSPKFGQPPSPGGIMGDRDPSGRLRKVRLAKSGSNSNFLPQINTSSSSGKSSEELIELSPRNSVGHPGKGESQQYSDIKSGKNRTRSRSRSSTLAISSLPAYNHTMDAARQQVAASSPLRAPPMTQEHQYFGGAAPADSSSLTRQATTASNGKAERPGSSHSSRTSRDSFTSFRSDDRDAGGIV